MAKITRTPPPNIPNSPAPETQAPATAPQAPATQAPATAPQTPTTAPQTPTTAPQANTRDTFSPNRSTPDLRLSQTQSSLASPSLAQYRSLYQTSPLQPTTPTDEPSPAPAEHAPLHQPPQAQAHQATDPSDATTPDAAAPTQPGPGAPPDQTQPGPGAPPDEAQPSAQSYGQILQDNRSPRELREAGIEPRTYLTQRREATTQLAQMASDGDSEALELLRTVADDPNAQHASYAAEALAHVSPDALEAEDYPRMTRAAYADGFLPPQTQQTLQNAIEQGTPGALDAVMTPLNTLDHPPSEALLERQQVALQFLQDANLTQHLSPAQLQQLTPLAASAESAPGLSRQQEALSQQALDLLTSAANQSPPQEGAIDALRQTVSLAAPGVPDDPIAAGSARRSAEALASVNPEHLQGEDYRAIAEVFTTDGGRWPEAVQSLFSQGLQEGRPEAISALEAPFSTDPAQLSPEAQQTLLVQQGNTIDFLHEAGAGAHLSAPLLQGLSGYTNQPIMRDGRAYPPTRAEEAMHLLTDAARSQPPPEGAMEALLHTLQTSPPHPSYRSLRATGEDAAFEVFARQSPPTLTSQHQDYVQHLRTRAETNIDDDAMNNAELASLGRFASLLPAQSPLLAQSMETLRRGLENPSQHAIAGMRAAQEHMGPAELDTILRSLEHGPRRAQDAHDLYQLFADNMDRVPPEQHTAALDRISNAITTDQGHSLHVSGDTTALERRIIAHFSDSLTGEHTQMLSTHYRRGATNEAFFQDLLATHPNADVRAHTAELFLDHADPQDQAIQESLTDYALTQDDPTMRQRVLRWMPNTPISRSERQAVEEAYSTELGERMQHAEEGSPLHRFAQLSFARNLAQDIYGDYRDNVNTDAVNEGFDQLLQEPSFVDTLQECHAHALEQAGEGLAERQVEFMTSETFQRRLSLMPPEEQGTYLNQQFGILQQVGDQSALHEVREHLTGRAFQDNALAAYQSMSPEEQQDAIAQGLGDLAGLGQRSSDVARRLSDALDNVPGSTSTRQLTNALLETLEAQRRAARAAGQTQDVSELSTTMELVRNLNARGGLSTLVTGAALVGLATQGAPENLTEGLALTGGLFSAAGNATDIGKFFGVNDASRLGRFARALEFLGPLGDAISTGFEIDRLGDELRREDWVGVTSSIAGIGAGTAGVVGGIGYLASTAWAPPLLLGSAIVGLAAWGFDELFGQSAEEEFLRDNGFWQD